MSSILYNTWGEFRHAAEQILDLTTHELCIFDADLAQLGLNQLASIERLQRLLAGNPAASIRIALKRTDHLHRDHPRLIQLLGRYGHRVHLQQIPDNLAHLRDTLVISDARHALIRFDQDHPRGKLILAEPEKIIVYRQRFDDIWNEGGTPFSPAPLGL
ncbi:hypothetical protein [Azovibrio restrictus]|uniref:DUF7931 domain-containing protein n=1 Tax=Azovibrio restrictus TaxID=146938 RepID=UPI0026EA4D86|nr:hypothetical protein [Azovibrio restrictus]